jgi:hypothetical protein
MSKKQEEEDSEEEVEQQEDESEDEDEQTLDEEEDILFEFIIIHPKFFLNSYQVKNPLASLEKTKLQNLNERRTFLWKNY